MGVFLLLRSSRQPQNPHNTHQDLKQQAASMSEAHFDEFEHYNFDQDKAMRSGHSGKQRTKKEASMNTNKQPGRTREENRDEADERREEQLEPGSATRGGQLEKLNLSQILSSNNTTS